MEATAARPTATWREVGALILLPFGGIVVPVLGWFAGLVFLWVSDLWSTRDKLIGTLVIPGGLVIGFWYAFLDASTTSATICFARPDGGRGQVCTGGATNVWAIVLGVFLLAAPLAADGYLLWRLRRRAA